MWPKQYKAYRTGFGSATYTAAITGFSHGWLGWRLRVNGNGLPAVFHWLKTQMAPAIDGQHMARHKRRIID